jgi:hypothetical protein
LGQVEVQFSKLGLTFLNYKIIIIIIFLKKEIKEKKKKKI